ncbi:MAG: hypothetical protein IPG86_05815 [Chitinophagaceae bacterium]|nr:hypothetical protein [Chitinophagaceae bacterium]
MQQWFGTIRTGELINIPHPGIFKGLEPMKDTDIRFVGYADCQQLQIWLPYPGNEYERLRLVSIPTEEIQNEWAVADIITGSVKLIIDSSVIPPGEYRLEMEKQGHCVHTTSLTKYKEREEPPATENETFTETALPTEGYIQYRDGWGNLIPDEDLILRGRVLQEMSDRFSRRLEYHSEGRSGTVVYVEGDKRLSFYYEFGGGDCVAFIDVPVQAKWEKETGLSIERRADIMECIAQTALRDQVSNGYYKISDNAISLYRK